jgi:ribosomal protein S27AE
MAYHDFAFQADAKVRLQRPHCPRCGDAPLFPHIAEFAGERRIRHSWVCETCGNAFQTTVKLPSGAGARDRD